MADDRVPEQLHEIEKSIDVMANNLQLELIELRRTNRRIADALELMALSGASDDHSRREKQLVERIGKRGRKMVKR